MAQAHLGELARSKVFHQGVAPGREAQDDVDRLLVFQVQGDAALVAGVERPPGRDTVNLLAPLPDRIAGLRLDLDDVRAQIGEQPRAERRGDEMADLENAQARQRAVRGSLRHLLTSPSLYDFRLAASVARLESSSKECHPRPEREARRGRGSSVTMKPRSGSLWFTIERRCATASHTLGPLPLRRPQAASGRGRQSGFRPTLSARI